MNAAFASGSFSTASFSIEAFSFDVVEKKGGSANNDWDFQVARKRRLAFRDQQDILDIATILGFVVDEL